MSVLLTLYEKRQKFTQLIMYLTCRLSSLSFTISGQVEYVEAAIKWGVDYFLKCHTENSTLYGQVGSSSILH